jgi:hypothetical protein
MREVEWQMCIRLRLCPVQPSARLIPDEDTCRLATVSLKPTTLRNVRSVTSPRIAAQIVLTDRFQRLPQMHRRSITFQQRCVSRHDRATRLRAHTHEVLLLPRAITREVKDSMKMNRS